MIPPLCIFANFLMFTVVEIVGLSKVTTRNREIGNYIKDRSVSIIQSSTHPSLMSSLKLE